MRPQITRSPDQQITRYPRCASGFQKNLILLRHANQVLAALHSRTHSLYVSQRRRLLARVPCLAPPRRRTLAKPAPHKPSLSRQNPPTSTPPGGLTASN